MYLAPNDDWYLLWDNAGSLTVSTCAESPVCTVTATATVPTSATAGAPVALTATGTPSGCGAGAPTYTWDFGDGTSAGTTASLTHVYAAAGTYTWAVTVQAGSATAVRTGTITVSPGAACTPTAAVVAAQTPLSLAAMWQGTGVTVAAGQVVTVTVAAGQTWTKGGEAWTAAGNAADPTSPANSPLPGGPRMALVGRTGTTGASFLVGPSAQVAATASGELFLAPNDEWYLVWGNAGSLTVSICVGASGGASAPVAWRPGGPAIPPSPAPVIVASGLLALLAVAMGTRRRRRVVGAAVVLCLLVPATALAQTTTQVIEYYTTDALGSVRAVTKKVNGQWTVVARHDYMPFGEEVAPPSPPQDKRLFTGKERDNETGMDYFGARYYRADVGRFTTVDPVQTISENLTDPQRWNRYSYVRNNPLRYTDPDGRLPVEPWKASGHTDLTTAAMSGQGGLSSQDVARAVEANIAVDALSNQTNDPAHYMPGTGAEATKLIDQLLDTAVKAEVGGRHSEAMKALGQALHTVQDRYAHDAQNAGWLAHMNGSAPDNPAKHPKEYQDAKRASQEFVQRYLAEVKKKRESEPNSSPEKR